ncbi:hypothetical protein [Pleomorphomonas sp. JP5]|uniref:hypothetical protein n=1 Tax=Pleomorphomonas sp. JP5 TaxID=2942998 RepID=UPI00204457D9|nr:hypothetical protein [Pleomorphomonas sp. JP5]MCM5558884.1 hypothetical protein [Pleomorphomonas sp. JP5]
MQTSVSDTLEQFQQKWVPVLRPELRLNKEIEFSGEPEFTGKTLGAVCASVDEMVSPA